MLKVLVGVASVAIIAAVGYFFWGEWQRDQALKAAEAEIEAAKVAECESVKADLQTVMAGKDLGRRFVQSDARQLLLVCIATTRLPSTDLVELKLR